MSIRVVCSSWCRRLTQQVVVLLAAIAGLAASAGLALPACGADPVGAELPLTPDGDAIVGGQSYSGLPAVGALVSADQAFCTGTLIAPRTVLTAAHCLTSVSAGTVGFAIGTNAAKPAHLLGARRLEVHPGFDSRTLANDVAMVHLKSDAPVTPLPVLAQMDADWVDTELFFLGFGMTNAVTGRGAGKKRGVWIPVTEVGDTTFAYAAPGRNTCYGDSGGPALHRDAVGAWFVAGVTSWGDARCSRFGVDTRVDRFLDFLGIDRDELDPCHGETYAGRCHEDTVIWCEDDQVQSMDCTPYGNTCAYDADAGFYNCSGPT
jgi:hypothetical protein